ncbi:MAG: class I SAM-dependent methyltransferase [Actinomycetota bacterium]|nr:class I SAM-dependent methyltransferase [Actinomycetota bacterium]
MTALVVPAYLAGDNPRAQSGHSGDEARWEEARRLVVDAIDRDGTFLDVGCASGHLMETGQAWAAEDGYAVEPYGLEISPELADLARSRLRQWADRIWVGNALHWRPPRRFDFVRAGLEYVPPHRRPDLIEHLLAEVCEPGGRLILGVRNELRNAKPVEHEVAAWGFHIIGRTQRPHTDPRVVRRAFWIDAA